MRTRSIQILTGILTAGIFACAAYSQSPSRAPFVLELPQVSTARYTLPILKIPQQEITIFRIKVLDPFAPDIDYGRIIVTLNGEGINRGCSKSRDGEGKVVICRHASEVIRGFDFVSGKNILEVHATDRHEREYYASYLINIGDKTASIDSDAGATNKAETFHGRKFAVIIGISEYQYADAGLRNLDFADDDALAFANFLQTPAGGSFARSDIRLMLNGNATRLAVRSSLEQIAALAKPEDLVVVFIAGHGAPDPLAPKNLYFLLNDTKVVDMEHTAFAMGELKRYLDTQLAAQRVLVLIDTCHSAGINQQSKSLVSGRDLVREGDENNISNFFLAKQLFNEKGRAIITSSDVNEVSQESPKWGNHGVFTWALLEGLKGKADFNGDRLITTGELFQYTRSSVQQATAFQQNPISLSGASVNLTLAALSK